MTWNNLYFEMICTNPYPVCSNEINLFEHFYDLNIFYEFSNIITFQGKPTLRWINNAIDNCSFLRQFIDLEFLSEYRSICVINFHIFFNCTRSIFVFYNCLFHRLVWIILEILCSNMKKYECEVFAICSNDWKGIRKNL